MLFGGLCHNLYRAIAAAELALGKRNAAVDQREQGVILADADVRAGIEVGAALTHENVAGNALLAAELLDAKATAGRVTTVAR